MFVLRAGCKVPFPEKLSEEYMLIENQIIANISADKIKDIMNHLSTFMKNLFFSFLSYPLNRITRKRFDRVLWKNA